MHYNASGNIQVSRGSSIVWVLHFSCFKIFKKKNPALHKTLKGWSENLKIRIVFHYENLYVWNIPTLWRNYNPLEIHHSRWRKLASIILLLFNKTFETITFSWNISYLESFFENCISLRPTKMVSSQIFLSFILSLQIIFLWLLPLSENWQIYWTILAAFFPTIQSSSTTEKSRKGTERTDIIKQRKEGVG